MNNCGALYRLWKATDRIDKAMKLDGFIHTLEFSGTLLRLQLWRVRPLSLVVCLPEPPVQSHRQSLSLRYEKMLRVHWRPSVVQSYNDDVIVHTSLLPDFVIVTECRGKIYGGFFDNMAVNWELTFPTKHEKFWSWERNLRAWLEKTVEMQNQCAHPTSATTNRIRFHVRPRLRDPWVRLETKDRGDLKLDLKTRGMCLVPY
ncbi:hypothetical protein Tco_1439145 [Tanacetum coccineum]